VKSRAHGCSLVNLVKRECFFINGLKGEQLPLLQPRLAEKLMLRREEANMPRGGEDGEGE
jgi:hypothetical protein